MSGPKSSTITVDLAWERELARQRAEAEARRQEELAIKRAKKRITEIDKKINQMIDEISSFMNEILNKQEIVQVNQGAADAINRQKQQTTQSLREIQSASSNATSSKDLEAFAYSKENKAHNIKSRFMSATHADQRALEAAAGIAKTEEKIQKSQMDFANIQALGVASVFDFDIHAVQSSDTEFEQLVVNALNHCRARRAHESEQKLCSIYDRIIKMLESQIEHQTVAVNKYSINEELNKLKSDEEYYLKRATKMRLLREEYEALCSLADVDAASPEQFSDPDAYIREIAFIREQYKRIDEQEYIADTIDEVMEEFGYHPINAEILDSDHISYVAEDETMLNVYTGSDNSIMIETAVLASNDASEDEEYAYEAQLAFCSMHPQIVARLADKGIRFKQKSYAPPSKDHNRIISTVNTETVKKASENKVATNRRRIRRGTKLQQMS